MGDDTSKEECKPYLLLPAKEKTNKDNHDTFPVGTIVFFHGWAQNKNVFSFKTKNMTKKLCQAGYNCLFLDGPIRLPPPPPTAAAAAAKKRSCPPRANARAWFAFHPTNPSLDSDLPQRIFQRKSTKDRRTRKSENSNLPQESDNDDSNDDDDDNDNAATAIQYYQMEESLEYVDLILSDFGMKKTSSNSCFSNIVAAIGFSHGAAFCHVLAQLASSLTTQNHATAARTKTVCSCIPKFILVSGYPICLLQNHVYAATRRVAGCGQGEDSVPNIISSSKDKDTRTAAAAIINNNSGKIYGHDSSIQKTGSCNGKNHDNIASSSSSSSSPSLLFSSLHFIGMADTTIVPDQSLELYRLFFCDSNAKNIIWKHDKGHIFPTHQAATETVLAFLAGWNIPKRAEQKAKVKYWHETCSLGMHP